MSSVDRYVETHHDELLETALELLSYDTANPPGETSDIADYVEDTLAELGLTTDRVSVDPAKPNVIARLPGARSATLCFNGHLDTVPFDRSAWTYDPLGERVDDRLYGRGATDMKGPLAAMLLVARAFAEAEDPPPVSMAFAMVSDEEVGGAAGLPAVIEAGAFEPDACIIGETTCEGGRHSVAVADRGSIWLTLEASGVAAHGSRPMLGINAIDRLYQAIETIRALVGSRTPPLPEAVRPVVEESVEYYASSLGERTARSLFTRPTINLGTIEGGEAINTVAESASARLDIRIPPGVEPGSILEAIRSCVAGCDGVSIGDVSWSTGSFDPIDEPLVEALVGVAGEVSGERIYRRSGTGGGDAKTARHAGVPTVEFALGTETVHAVDEYTTVEALVRNARIYARLPAAYEAAISG